MDGLVLAGLEAAGHLPPGEMLQQQLVVKAHGAGPGLPFHDYQVDRLGQAQGVVGRRSHRLAFHVHLFRKPGQDLAVGLGDVLPALQQGVGQPGHGLFEGLGLLRAKGAAAGPLGLVLEPLVHKALDQVGVALGQAQQGAVHGHDHGQPEGVGRQAVQGMFIAVALAVGQEVAPQVISPIGQIVVQKGLDALRIEGLDFQAGQGQGIAIVGHAAGHQGAVARR